MCDQRQAETAVFFAVQGVVALKQARQRVIRQRRACRVVQRKTGFMVALADGEGDGTAVRRFADGVVEQVGQCLLQPERVGAERDGGALVRRVVVMDEAQGEVFLCETWLLFALLFAPEGGEVKRLFVDGFFFRCATVAAGAARGDAAACFVGRCWRRSGRGRRRAGRLAAVRRWR